MKLTIPILILLIFLCSGCQNKPDNRSSSKVPSESELIDLNKSLITKDRGVITEYLGKSRQSFSETNTGLWYSILSEGNGEKVKTGDNVTFDYECTLLDGSPCYSGSQTIRVGYAGAESGVTEGLQLMNRGSDYMFIIPPYLAYGHTGDGGRIPGRAILVYRIRIMDIN
ncbi:MAG: FKBP-type peptidyl-prolyl cis-trans isomerase [Bacteroidales bacterium]|nr:FKBP-type peptidyl-prolyl cis-trans isomerase [Bacteroidales bacterium]